MVAPAESSRSMWLGSPIGPVKNVPAGTTTRPPPRAEQSAMALANAPVFSVVPSPTPPYRVTSQSTFGNVGATIRLKMPGTMSQPAAASSLVTRRSEDAAPPPAPSVPPKVAPTAPRVDAFEAQAGRARKAREPTTRTRTFIELSESACLSVWATVAPSEAARLVRLFSVASAGLRPARARPAPLQVDGRRYAQGRHPEAVRRKASRHAPLGLLGARGPRRSHDCHPVPGRPRVAPDDRQVHAPRPRVQAAAVRLFDGQSPGTAVASLDPASERATFPGEIGWSNGGSNPGPPHCERGALPAELLPQMHRRRALSWGEGTRQRPRNIRRGPPKSSHQEPCPPTCPAPAAPRRLSIAGDERSREQPPAAGGDEKQELERQADLRRAHLLHAERQEQVGNHEVDHQEWQVDQKADCESFAELGHDEGGHEHRQGVSP